jgi:hypothetical protein
MFAFDWYLANEQQTRLKSGIPVLPYTSLAYASALRSLKFSRIESSLCTAHCPAPAWRFHDAYAQCITPRLPL